MAQVEIASKPPLGLVVACCASDSEARDSAFYPDFQSTPFSSLSAAMPPNTFIFPPQPSHPQSQSQSQPLPQSQPPADTEEYPLSEPTSKSTTYESQTSSLSQSAAESMGNHAVKLRSRFHDRRPSPTRRPRTMIMDSISRLSDGDVRPGQRFGHRRMQTVASGNTLTTATATAATATSSALTPAFYEQHTHNASDLNFNFNFNSDATTQDSAQSLPPSPATGAPSTPPPRSRGHQRSQSFTVSHHGPEPVFSRLRPVSFSPLSHVDISAENAVVEEDSDEHDYSPSGVADELSANFEFDDDPATDVLDTSGITASASDYSELRPSLDAPRLTITPAASTVDPESHSPGSSSVNSAFLQPSPHSPELRSTTIPSRRSLSSFNFGGEIQTMMRNTARSESGMIDIDLGVDPLSPTRPATSGSMQILRSAAIPPVPPIPAEYERRASAPAYDRRRQQLGRLYEVQEETEGDSRDLTNHQSLSYPARRRHRPSHLHISTSMSNAESLQDSPSSDTPQTPATAPLPLSDSETPPYSHRYSATVSSLAPSTPTPRPTVALPNPVTQPDMSCVAAHAPRPTAASHLAHLDLHHHHITSNNSSSTPRPSTSVATIESRDTANGSSRSGKRKKSRAKKFKKLLMFWKTKEKS